jgi:hypothetical protein
VKVQNTRRYYICYNVLIKSPIKSKYYLINRNLIKNFKTNVDYCWRETHSMKRFFITELIEEGILTNK